MALTVGDGFNRGTSTTTRPKTTVRYPASGVGAAASPNAPKGQPYSKPAPVNTSAAVSRKLSVNKTGQYAAPIAPAPVAPGPIPEINPPVTPQDPNQDSQYVQEMAAYAAALKQFQDKQLFDASTQQQNTTTGLAELGDKQTLDQGSLLEDYASRGLGDSGIYLGERQKLDNQYGDQRTQLEQLLQQFLGGQKTDQQAFQSQQKINQDSAANQAIQRLLAARGVA